MKSKLKQVTLLRAPTMSIGDSEKGTVSEGWRLPNYIRPVISRSKSLPLRQRLPHSRHSGVMGNPVTQAICRIGRHSVINLRLPPLVTPSATYDT